eukprot:3425391-Rhodomonas_salina.2
MGLAHCGEALAAADSTQAQTSPAGGTLKFVMVPAPGQWARGMKPHKANPLGQYRRAPRRARVGGWRTSRRALHGTRCCYCCVASSHTGKLNEAFNLHPQTRVFQTIKTVKRSQPSGSTALPALKVLSERCRVQMSAGLCGSEGHEVS